MAKLQVEWKSANTPSAVTTGTRTVADVTDYSSATAILTAADREVGKPFLVYLSSDSEEFRVERDNIEATTLKDERVALGSRLFTMVKVDSSTLSESHPFARWLYSKSDAPRFVAFAADGTRVGELEGVSSPSKLFQLMRKAAGSEYVVNLDTWVKDYQKVLTEMDKLDGLKNALAEKESRAQTKAQLRDIEIKKAIYDKEEQKLATREKTLLDLKRKNAV